MSISRGLRRDFITYGIGYLLAILLTGAAFACVFYRLLSPQATFGVILGLALIQIIVHMRCFLHISLKRSARADLQLILFSAVIILLMVGGTLVILGNLMNRMM
ncbi:cytochrome o ubiquinol oxidase subunit IV [Acidisoma sp.]|uniref:cytochrome o ubiquinol oxidase subunit IV n=1 Tax=Acidisoma sp. TaxID=1872115 RepID=UPI003B001CB2